MTQVSKALPGWAVEFMDGWRNRPYPFFSIDDELDHRREAFYRLYQATGPDVEAMWNELDYKLDLDWRKAFLHDVVLGTDAIIPDEPLPVYGAQLPPKPRLKTRQQRLARKLADQVQLLAACTPPRCIARDIVLREASPLVEALVIYFEIGQVPRDYDQCWRKSRLGIEFTTSSKRGWIQHRRASDTVRRQVIQVSRQMLAEQSISPAAIKLIGHFVGKLECLPSMLEEHQNDPVLSSQKAGYLDWFRYVYQESITFGKDGVNSPLSNKGWATLAEIISGELGIDPDDIAHARSGYGQNLR